MKKLLLPILLLVTFWGCDDTVDIELDSVEPFVNVDAWLTHTADTQQIRLTFTCDYFDNEAPTPVLGATVVVADLETLEVYPFEDTDDDGIYEWVPPSGSLFGSIGHSYGLEIVYEGNTYQSISAMDSVPAIDSITFEYNEKDAFFSEDWYYGEFWARDLPGPGNTYWVKSFVNGELMDDPENINIPYDAGFSAGGEVDSLIFIQPIRTAITPQIDGTPAESPFKIGDQVRVELHAISYDAWFFLFRVQDETFRNPGFGQLFANPLANSPTNIITSDESVRVAGFFSVASVSALEVEVSEETILDRIPE